MKDELNGIPIAEFCALRAKMYSVKVTAEEGQSKMVAKGVPRVALKKRTTHRDYLEVLR